MLSSAVSSLRRGVRCGSLVAYASKVTHGRFAEERTVEISVRSAAKGKKIAGGVPLMLAKVFYGRPPDCGPWAELYSISPRISAGGRSIAYFGSPMEKRLLRLFSGAMRKGQLFVEYGGDRATLRQLRLSVPPAATRLGSLMLALGFTWFKDWYYPEGFMEGGMKLQGEKAGSASERKRMLSELLAEAPGLPVPAGRPLSASVRAQRVPSLVERNSIKTQRYNNV